jgi:hypothetical protein
MATTEEEALVGWDEICSFLRCELSSSQRRRLRDAKVIFNRLEGRPPNRRKKIFTFPSLLQRYLMIKGCI